MRQIIELLQQVKYMQEGRQRQVAASSRGAPITMATDWTENRSQASRYTFAVSELYLWSKIFTKLRHILEASTISQK